MTLLLDGQKIQGKNLKVVANLRIESGDLSGQTSNTEKAHKGFKPKTLAVTMTIPFNLPEQLRELMRLAEATSSGGQLHLYRVVNDTADAFGVRQVEFSEGVSVREHDSLSQWQIQFTLSERQSNPEKVEGRRPAGPVKAQVAPGAVIGETPEAPATPGLTGFEKALSKIDKWLE
ncbi:DNA-binding protein [Pseudomonas sp. 15A4]|uniref:baseplate complex protein n=1 Tax=Pseudomonas sp. 15A4 TaxID=2804761 RepID=UPI001967BBEB|nr:DNA-binding protein [Pseudomonas sp. 15A4]QSB20610.1 DNA-binding protein [Pseudomonas sp. 15A4]